jgi:hypothetical protein
VFHPLWQTGRFTLQGKEEIDDLTQGGPEVF